MPLSKHFGGHGEEVMQNMKKTYGAKKAKQVFYATENKMKSHLPEGYDQSPKGNLGAARQCEAKEIGTFKGATKEYKPAFKAAKPNKTHEPFKQF